jgi:hypothetical protein
MIEYEVRGENGHVVRVLAEDEAGAFEIGLEEDSDIEMASVYPAAGLPIGWQGGDAHEAMDEYESLENGDIK